MNPLSTQPRPAHQQPTIRLQPKHIQLYISMDFFLGTVLDDYLFKLRGTDQLVWIPHHEVQASPGMNHCFELNLDLKRRYCCARLMISNPIRMCLFDQHQVKGKDLIPYLMHEAETD